MDNNIRNLTLDEVIKYYFELGLLTEAEGKEIYGEGWTSDPADLGERFSANIAMEMLNEWLEAKRKCQMESGEFQVAEEK